MSEREASRWRAIAGGIAACDVCPHRCEIPPEGLGKCGVRRNFGGVLYVTNDEEATRVEIEAIERVPLYHFKPGARVLALGSLGESFPVELAPPTRPAGLDVDSRFATPGEVIDIAIARKAAAIACAGGEPFMWLEQWLEIAAAARAAGLANIALTNAYALPPAVAEIAPLLDAANVVLLGGRAAYRRRGLDLAPVLDAARALQAAGAHLELTFLVLSGENEFESDVAEFVAVAQGLGAPPVHLASPVHPETAAPVKTVLALAAALEAKLPRVHLSPVYGPSRR